jgi:hypothetical protein
MQKILSFFKTTRPVWEYKVIPIIDPEDGNFVEYELIMNALGDLGWELASIYKDFLIFKKCSNITK